MVKIAKHMGIPGVQLQPVKSSASIERALLPLVILQFAAGLIALYLVEVHFIRLGGPPRQVTNLNDSWLILMEDSVDCLWEEGNPTRFLTSRIKATNGVTLETAEGLPGYLVVRHSGVDSNLVWVIDATSHLWQSDYHVIHASKLPDFLQEERKRLAKR